MYLLLLHFPTPTYLPILLQTRAFRDPPARFESIREEDGERERNGRLATDRAPSSTTQYSHAAKWLPLAPQSPQTPYIGSGRRESWAEAETGDRRGVGGEIWAESRKKEVVVVM